MSRYRVLLVEDDAPTRARLARVIGAHPELELLAAVGTCREGREALARAEPDVLLTDLGLPDGDGIELVRALRELGYSTLAMVVTVFGDERHVVSAIEGGALGYLLKDATAATIGESILELIRGGSPISPPIARSLLRRLRPDAPTGGSDPMEAPLLSAREQEVLTHIVKGFSYGEIAALIAVSTHTVASHVRSIYRKLAVHSRGEAVYEALQLGLVRLDE
jgi:DNA-binding NarL/FixJ family response regulator